MYERSILFLSVAAFASAASMRVTDPLLPLLAAEFGVTPGGAAAVITGFALAYGLLQIVSGPLADRVGKYRMVFIMCALSAAGTLYCAFATTLGALVAARFASGATLGALIPLSMAWLGDVVPYERRQLVLARFLIGQMLGMAFGTSAAGLLGERFGWRAIFFVLTALYVVVALLLWTELRRNPLTRQVGSEATGSMLEGYRRMAGLIARPWVRVIVLTVFVEGAVFFGVLSFVAYDLQHRFGLGLGTSGMILAAFAAGGLLYAAVARRLVLGLGERGLVLAGGLLIGAGYMGLLLIPTGAAAVPCVLAIGAGFYMLHGTLQVHATQMAPEARGAAVALFVLSLFMGQSTGVWIGGRIVDAAGTPPLFLIACIGVPLLALDFRRRLSRRSMRTTA